MPSDVTGLVDVGPARRSCSARTDAVAVMESIYRISDQQDERVTTTVITNDDVLKDLVQVRLPEKQQTSPTASATRRDRSIRLLDPQIVGGPNGVFSTGRVRGDNGRDRASSARPPRS